MGSSGKLPFGTKALYGLGTVALGIKEHGFNMLLMIYYNQVVGLPAAWVGLAIMIAMILDAITDPVVGRWSDNIRTRWGRRHPFMYASALPVGLCYLLLWIPPAGASHEVLFVYLLVLISFTRMAIGVYEVPSMALLAEFTQDYHERTILVAFRFFFAVLGGVAMGMFAFGVIFAGGDPVPGEEVSAELLNPRGYAFYAFIAGPVMAVAIFLSAWGTHRLIPDLAVPVMSDTKGIWATLREMCETVFHRANAPILLGTLFGAISGGLSSALNIYFATYFWKISASDVAILTSSALAGIPLAFAVVLPLSKVFGKKWTTVTLFSVSFLANIIPLGLRLLGLFPGNDSPALLPLLYLSTGINYMCTIAASILAVSMVADVSEQVRLRTGKQSEGVLFSATSFINKAVAGVGVFSSGVLLTMVGFPEAARPDTIAPEIVDHLVMGFIMVAMVFSAIGISCLAFYPITRQVHKEAVEELARRDAVRITD